MLFLATNLQLLRRGHGSGVCLRDNQSQSPTWVKLSCIVPFLSQCSVVHIYTHAYSHCKKIMIGEEEINGYS